VSAAVVYKGGKVQVTTNPDRVAVSLSMCNIGATTAAPFLVEVQPKFKNPLSFVTAQNVCNPQYPQNVHVIVHELRANECTDVLLAIPAGILVTGKYDLYAASTKGSSDGEACCTYNSNCAATDPFGWSTYITSFNVYKAGTPVCGDGGCQPGENVANCKTDCVSWCGDQYCDPNTNKENMQWCPGDCKNAVCGNAACETGESVQGCPSDCKTPTPSVVSPPVVPPGLTKPAWFGWLLLGGALGLLILVIVFVKKIIK